MSEISEEPVVQPHTENVVEQAFARQAAPVAKPETFSGQFTVGRVKPSDDGKRYTLTLSGEYYSKWINDESDKTVLEGLRSGDTVSITWVEKESNGKIFKNIRFIEKVGGSSNLSDFKGTDEDFNKKRIEGITFGMAMNNAMLLFAEIARSQENPEEWIKENIGSTMWKAIEQKVYEDYKAQREHILGE